MWQQQTGIKVTRFTNVSVYEAAADTVAVLAVMVERTIRLQVTTRDGDIWIANDANDIHVQLETLKTTVAT